MLMQAVDTYLAVRRAAGFALEPIEYYLRHFVRFAATVKRPVNGRNPGLSGHLWRQIAIAPDRSVTYFILG